ncbi:ATP-binding cassette domain-containing protein [Lampropedia aestuarii]|uniref:ATP-binding cassette domain-containing protein n=1 Tax=Lampropedia aestuarii TaxID=2562762 RepID=A0A4S5BXR9_9BURK|nr:ATP-binding cassette domain-containing protein [Lampropedia aestuarii]MDH5855761.1 ATP-binding cassette domain-containing protein [Lampropedia aestuarii]THJ36091.1 ATP-binding cassette domain-containing protein [Lampropedia aestuarii]
MPLFKRFATELAAAARASAYESAAHTGSLYTTQATAAQSASQEPAKAQPVPGVRLQLQAVSKRFGEREVLHPIDLEVQPGEFVAIVGRSGCGKSTLLRLVAGLEAASTGQLSLDGQPLKGLNENTRIMFQDARLLPWKSVLHNVALGLPKSQQQHALQVLAQVGLLDRAQDWPANLSGGQRQRVALARALVHEPRLLLLDEPLGALDALTRIEMHALIERLWSQLGFTALLVTHDVQEAIALADRVLLIEDGAIALDERITLAHPRVRGSAEFAAIEQRLLGRVLAKPAQAEPPQAPPSPTPARWQWAI